MIHPMELRGATIDDVERVLPMVRAICALHESWDPAKYGFIERPEERYRKWLGDRAADPRSAFFVAENDAGELVGFIVGTVEREIPVYWLAEFGFIHDLWVAPDYRNEGVGRQLSMLAVERFRGIGVSQIRLDTAANNEAARNLFGQCGFRAATVQMLLEIESPTED